jgi:methyl halide transferase
MKQDLNASYWNNRYLQNETGWDTRGITTPLKMFFDGLSDKNLRILIPGAGNAYEAEYLLSKGFNNLFVCDFASEPLKHLKERCPGIKDENLLQKDFFELSGFSFDLIIEQTFFCALDPALRRRYFEKMFELLSPGGSLAGVLFDDELNTEKPPFGGSSKEYRAYFIDIFTIHTYETCYNSIAPREGREIFIHLKKKEPAGKH